jgi:nitroreductase/NAD-dependent dihydropyrimidine dehydrogenase PreA subunit
MFKKSIDYEVCDSCMLCENICTNSRVIAANAEGLPEFAHDERCIRCGHCLAICPRGAITFTVGGQIPEDSYVAKTQEMKAAALPGEGALLEFLSSTRSSRLFLDKPVEIEKITKVLDAMVRAPSAGNEQNRRFYLLAGKDKIEDAENRVREHYSRMTKAYQSPVMSRVLACMSAMNTGKRPELPASKLPFKERYRLFRAILASTTPQEDERFTYLKRAGAVVIVTTDPGKGMMHKPFYRGDACIAVTYGTLAARAVGLESCWMGLLEMALNRNAKIRDALGIRRGERVDGALALGYSGTKWMRLPPRGPVNVTWL